MSQRVFPLLLCVAVTGAVAGCGSLSRLSEVGRPPAMTPTANPTQEPTWRPVAMPMPAGQPAPNEPNALWRSGSRAFFKDQRAAQVGDIVTVLVNMNDNANLKNITATDRTSKESGGMPNFFGMETLLPKTIVDPAKLLSISSGNNNMVEPADAIGHAAANALLKTLEEPQPGRYLWLVSTEPARLPATIRSRCQKLEFRLPPHDEALAWLRSRGHAERSAQEALDAARGHPGLADAWLRDGGLDLRRSVAEDLARLARGDASPAETAQRWAADEHASLRLRFAADHALAQASGLTDARRTRTLAAWFDAANRTRALLRTTIRSDLAIAELLLSWQAQAAAKGAGAQRT